MDIDGSEVPPGLVYVNDAMPGILRRKRGRGFSYLHHDGSAPSPVERQRIARLAIPPAYRSVWICAQENGHLQATGHDDRGRKQYRYHPLWASWRSEAKYAQLCDFGLGLGRLRRRLQRDLAGDAGDLAFSLAALTLLIDRAFLRVGSEAYARENQSFGATTLLARHLTLADGTIRLRFRGKGGRPVTQTLRDTRLHRILQEIGDLPGRNLFTYLTPEGAARPVVSQQVNAYIAQATGVPEATAKTFRTWGGSLAAFEAARAETGRLTVKAMAEAAAALLVNTPAISKSSYIHPRILALAEMPPEARAKAFESVVPEGDAMLRATERRLLGFLCQPLG